jgi:hypothetical protein
MTANAQAVEKGGGLTETKNLPKTAPTQKAGFGVPKPVLWLIKH